LNVMPSLGQTSWNDLASLPGRRWAAYESPPRLWRLMGGGKYKKDPCRRQESFWLRVRDSGGREA
jgi:hypothetical protein